jgi:hypothetical protein
MEKIKILIILIISIILTACGSGNNGLDNPFNGKVSSKIQNVIDQAKAQGVDISDIDISNPWGHVEGQPLCTYTFYALDGKYEFKIEEYANETEMFDALEDYAGSETIVYAVADGRLFHKKDCDYIKDVTDPIELTVSEAMGNNLTSCQKCNPISDNISNRDEYLILLLPTIDTKILPTINIFRELWGYEPDTI